MLLKSKPIIAFLLFASVFAYSQDKPKGQLHGNFNIDAQQYKADSLIGAEKPAENVLMNAYGNFTYTYGNFSAGLRYEAYLNTLEGYDKSYNGQGISYRYLSYNNDGLGITVGNFYEQFGNGLLLRTYQEKMLGYDNAFDGVRVSFSAIKGLTIKGIVAKQRLFWGTEGLVRGVDGELSINELFESIKDAKTQVIIGGNYVSKYQADKDPFLKLPENVGASSGRISIANGGFVLSGEYAQKCMDPSSDNGYIYKQGQALLVNATYSRKGLGIYLTGKRVDNMSFRSDRGQHINNLNINYLPDVAKIHVYTLTAMYPSATQANGEMGMRSEIMYKFKKKSLLGGKYGTEIGVAYSRVNDIDRQAASDTSAIGVKGYLGYKSDFFKIGEEEFYEDITLSLSKKVSKKIKFHVEYMNQTYNFLALRGESDHSGYDMVYAQMGVADLSWKIKRRRTIRFEAQGLFTKQDKQDWAMGMIEFTMAPNWFIAVYDAYNYGNHHADKRLHYATGTVGFTKNSTRIQLSYGKSIEGVVCVGGVCRVVPATNGFSISISSTF